MRLEQSSTRNLQGVLVLVEAAISWVCGCGHTTGAAGHGELGAGAASRVPATTWGQAAGRAGVVSQVTPPNGCSTIQGCCPSMFLLKGVLGKERVSRVLADELLYWQQYLFAFGNTLEMAIKRGGAVFTGCQCWSRVPLEAVPPWSGPERAQPCPALPSSGKSRHCSRRGSGRGFGDVLWLQDFIVATAQREGQQPPGVGCVKYGSIGCVFLHAPCPWMHLQGGQWMG